MQIKSVFYCFIFTLARSFKVFQFHFEVSVRISVNGASFLPGELPLKPFWNRQAILPEKRRIISGWI